MTQLNLTTAQKGKLEEMCIHLYGFKNATVTALGNVWLGQTRQVPWLELCLFHIPRIIGVPIPSHLTLKLTNNIMDGSIHHPVDYLYTIYLTNNVTGKTKSPSSSY